MITRIWRGRTKVESARAYESHVTTVVFPKLEAIAGYLGGRLLRRVEGEGVEFLVLTDWSSWDAVRAFAGSRPDRAVVEPEARALLDHADENVQHFDLAHESVRR